jgi:ABC-type uncharacterized transport system, periplasmic component
MFHNQIAIAYHPSKVANPPKTFEELAAWVKANPNRFGYNGIKGGVSAWASPWAGCTGRPASTSS